MLGAQDKKMIITWCFLLYSSQAIKTWPHREIPMFHDRCPSALDIIRAEKHLTLPGARVSKKES